MKNIHLISTDKPSRLWTNNLKRRLELDEFPSQHPTNIAKNIYITSDEEIKEGDYVVQINFEKTNTQVIKCETEFQTEIANDKDGSYTKNKIILTTDQDLIKDGVQPIDDTFLEWLVKNPSCEEVEVFIMNDGYNNPEDVPYQEWYKIIIPKEEPKRKIDSCRYFNLEIGCVKDICKCEQEEPKQAYQEEQKELRRKLLNLIDNLEKDELLKLSKEEPEQETTLEKAAERNCESITHPYRTREKVMFTKGAKWQAERMYSEAIKFGKWLDENIQQREYYPMSTMTMEELFKQFKKK
jgi:hypothetical protein